jgi:hypothetical protein
MQGALQKGVAGAGALALVVAGTAFGKPFLPKRASYAGKTARDGKLAFKVRKHHIVLTTGTLPLRAGGTCQWAKDREAPLRLHNYNPVGNGPFKIKARQRAVNAHTGAWRKLRIRIEGRFDEDAERAKGTLHVTFRDADGRCETRDHLPWRLHRVRKRPQQS